MGVVGESEIEIPGISSVLEADRAPELTAIYADLNGRALAVPSEAFLIDPRPAPSFLLEEQRRPLPGIVDRESALALIAEVANGAATVPDPDSRSPITRAQRTGYSPSTHQVDYLPIPGYPPGVARCPRLQPGAEPNLVVARHRLLETSQQLRGQVLRPLADALYRLTTISSVPLTHTRGLAQTWPATLTPGYAP